MPVLRRRDFLKLGSAISGALAFPWLAHLSGSWTSSQPGAPNILILVFDAMAARHLSLYGYRRDTTPNLARLASRATVYHQHYTAGNFTTPSTASPLTGLYPWTHRAINLSGLIARGLVDHNLFRLAGKGYHRLAFSRNVWPNYFFAQFRHDLEEVLSPASFSLLGPRVSERFGADQVDSLRAFDELLFMNAYPPGSLIFGLADRIEIDRAIALASSPDYPYSLPTTTNSGIPFRLRDTYEGLARTTESLPEPFAAYFHMWAPHEPYRPTAEFAGRFADQWSPKPKPVHVLSDPEKLVSDEALAYNWQLYDEYLANTDAEFGRLLDSLDASGMLDRTYLVVTSDHGELHERGVKGHVTWLLYDPVARIPLLISSPGQRSRIDVNVPTSNVDLLPTLLHLSGKHVPDWCEGRILPGVGGLEDPQRSLFTMDAKESAALSPLSKGSFAIRKGPHKLIYYRGFPQYERRDHFELFDVDIDPEEVNDLFSETSSVAVDLRSELIEHLNTADAAYLPAE